MNATNPDGTLAPSFGFDISGNPNYEYPIITHVESKQSGERSGLQVDDILLKVNNRKTKGADFEKIKKAIEKARRDDHRVELLVIDRAAFHYCIKTQKKFKEPFIKMKHIFPRSRTSASYSNLPLVPSRASLTLSEHLGRTGSVNLLANIQHLPPQSENGEDDMKSPHFGLANDFDLTSPSTTSNPSPHDIPTKSVDPPRRLSQGADKPVKYCPRLHIETSPDESIVDFVLHTVNHLFHNTKTEKSTNRS